MCYLHYYDFINNTNEEILQIMIDKAEVPEISYVIFSILINLYETTKRDDVLEAMLSLQEIARTLIDDPNCRTSEMAEIFVEKIEELEE